MIIWFAWGRWPDCLKMTRYASDSFASTRLRDFLKHCGQSDPSFGQLASIRRRTQVATVPIVEFTIKCAADDLRILHDCINREQMRYRQFGIGVLKNQDVTRGSLRSAVHLFTAVRRV